VRGPRARPRRGPPPPRATPAPRPSATPREKPASSRRQQGERRLRKAPAGRPAASPRQLQGGGQRQRRQTPWRAAWVAGGGRGPRKSDPLRRQRQHSKGRLTRVGRPFTLPAPLVQPGIGSNRPSKRQHDHPRDPRTDQRRRHAVVFGEWPPQPEPSAMPPKVRLRPSR
jgi:hypothetical protein